MQVTITDRRRNLIFINIIISSIASGMLATALTTALPSIVNDFHISVTTGQWLTSGYSLAMGIMMPLTAYLITRFPTKRLYLSGLAVFIVGLFFCAIAPNFLTMMIARILQACGNGIIISMAQVILLTIYPSEKCGTVMGWYGLGIGVAPVIAPTLAGIIVDAFGWRTIFYGSLIIMGISFLWAIYAFDNVLKTEKKKFDILSFTTSIFAFGGITLGIGNVSIHGITSMQVLPFIVIGVLATLFFIYRQLHIRQPFLELRVMKNKNYALSVIGSILLYFVMMGSSMIMPLYAQSILGYSATISGLVMLPGSLAMAITSPFAGKLYDRIGMKKLFVIGAVCMLFSNVGMLFITMQTSIWLAAFYNIIRCVSIGCLLMPLVTWGIKEIPYELTAHGTALLSSLRTVAGSIGTAVFVGIMTFVANKSASTYGENAMMHGLNWTFLFMSLFTLVLVIIAVFFVKSRVEAVK